MDLYFIYGEHYLSYQHQLSSCCWRFNLPLGKHLFLIRQFNNYLTSILLLENSISHNIHRVDKGLIFHLAHTFFRASVEQLDIHFFTGEFDLSYQQQHSFYCWGFDFPLGTHLLLIRQFNNCLTSILLFENSISHTNINFHLVVEGSIYHFVHTFFSCANLTILGLFICVAKKWCRIYIGFLKNILFWGNPNLTIVELSFYCWEFDFS